MGKTTSFDVGGVAVTVEKKRIRNMYLRVQPPDGRVLLTAPLATPDAALRRFAESKLPWIQKQRQALLRQQPQRFAAGETVFLFGEPYLLDVQGESRRSNVSLIGRQATVTVPDADDESAVRQALDKWYRAALNEAVEALVPACERTVGRHAAGWRIRDMKTRWGTCNTASGVITLNLQLARRDKRYLRYVIFHELTHLIEPSHNARFYRLMDRFLPEWQTLRRQLKAGQ